MHMANSNSVSPLRLLTSESKAYPDSSLKLLWKKIILGDKTALSKLFNDTYDSLYSYGYRITYNPENVRDAIQEVFFQIWKYRKTLSQPDSVRAYLFISLRRELLKKKKANKRRDQVHNNYYLEEFDTLISYSKWEEILNLDDEESQELKKSIENLTPRQREVIYLKYFEGLSTEELAQILQVRTQSIYNLVFDAINSLRFFLNK